jgi:GNAT superfamily N-acetyltransferase
MIRPAKQIDHKRLTAISFKSKGYWDYPEEYFDIWNNELTLSAEYISNNNVFVYENNGIIEGYYSIIEISKNKQISGIAINEGFWLDHMFILPHQLGRGIGTEMFHHLRKWCQSEGIGKLGILADPHSRGFYEKMGCEYQKEYPSSIPNRTTPWLLFEMDNSANDRRKESLPTKQHIVEED